MLGQVPKEVVEGLSLEVFKTELYMALSKLAEICWLILLWAGSWTRDLPRSLPAPVGLWFDVWNELEI